MMNYQYVAIEREYGSGGTIIGKLLAQKCNMNFFGEEILKSAAEKLGISIQEAEKCEESVSSSFLFTIYAMSQMQSGNSDLLTQENKLFLAEQEFIKDSALNGPAVYIGHCAVEALKNKKVLRVFIKCSDSEKKKNRIKEDYHVSENDLEITRKRYDGKRSKYYHANTARKWMDSSNYDIILDSGDLGIDECVKIIEAAISE